jgi:hypothetical protein
MENGEISPMAIEVDPVTNEVVFTPLPNGN